MNKQAFALVVTVFLVVGVCQIEELAANSIFVTAVPVYELGYLEENPMLDVSFLHDRLLTTSVGEMNAAKQGGYAYLGIRFYVSPVQVPDSVPVYRLYNGDVPDHLYTASLQEMQNVQGAGYVYEGILGYIMPVGSPAPATVDLHRFNDSGYHSCLTDPTQGGGHYDGVVGKVWTGPDALTSIAITAPAAGAELRGGRDSEIGWKASGKSGYISLNFSADGGATWMLLCSGLENTGFWPWEVPNIDAKHARLQIVWVDYLFGPSNLLGQSETDYDFKIKKSSFHFKGPAGKFIKASALPPPRGLTASAVSPTQVHLSWKAGGAATKGYIIERKQAGQPFISIANLAVDKLLYIDQSAQPSTRYIYRVKGYAEQAIYACSKEAKATTGFHLKKISRKTKN